MFREDRNSLDDGVIVKHRSAKILVNRYQIHLTAQDFYQLYG